MKRQLIEARIFKINEKYRTLTPIEAERLNGFPDNWTDTMPDRMRYFCMGNALVVPIVTRIGNQIEKIEKLTKDKFSQLKLLKQHYFSVVFVIITNLSVI